MFSNLGNIIWFFIMPSNLIGLIFLIGLVLSLSLNNLSRKLLFFAAAMFVIFGFSSIGYNVVHYWESQYPYPVSLPSQITGIIVLGGAEETELSAAHGINVLNESGERLSHFSALALKFPNAKLVFSGGGGHPDRIEENEAYYAQSFFHSLGLPVEDIIFENKSRNTYENAAFSKHLAEPSEGETWLLVTSAFHMPRSMAVFEAQDWNVIPVPVDFQTGINYEILPLKFNVLKNLHLLNIGIKEMVGLIAYKITGKIN